MVESYHLRSNLNLGSLDSIEDVLGGKGGKLIREIQTTSSSLDDGDIGDYKYGI